MEMKTISVYLNTAEYKRVQITFLPGTLKIMADRQVPMATCSFSSEQCFLEYLLEEGVMRGECPHEYSSTYNYLF